MGGVFVCGIVLESKPERETGWLSVSGSTNSGAFSPTRGAPLEAGSCLVWKKTMKQKTPTTKRLRVPRIGPAIFPDTAAAD